MPVDRLKDLRSRQEQNGADEASCSGSAAIHVKIERLRKLNNQLEDAQMKHLATNDKKAGKIIEKTIGDIAREGQITRNLIVAFGNETQKLEASGSINASEKSMRKNVFENLVHKLEEVTKGSWDMQKSHEVSVTKQVEKRLRVRFSDQNGKSTMSDEELHRVAKQLVDSGAEEQVFLLAQDELDKATRTRDAVRELEREMRELYTIFCDLNTLIVEQSEGLQAAQDNVVRAHENVVVGQQNLASARKMQKKCCDVM
ncbi:SNARE protein, putative [Bodo saltans]|uniref:SNARE protein, putative n=1 Tax=Bodo saltans TaxID=75058 RepID=A0A0S4JI44_BODSA|nr:SNARE protein, putative [Bodo saltans]|eukprot:CUG88082.1 SNARE protein, putative [Bodo saltans]